MQMPFSLQNLTRLFGMIVVLLMLPLSVWAQESDSTQTQESPPDFGFSLLDEPDSSAIALLPARMMLTQRALYGKRGLMRKIGISPLTPEGREKEMKVRRTMLVLHQVVGFATVASIGGTAVTGQQLYRGNFERYNTHTTLAKITNIGYITGATLAFTAPPPLISRRKKGWNSTDWHKSLSVLHMAGMITTNILSKQAGQQGGDWTRAHRISGITTATAFTASVLVITFGK
jgi:hypothetical protein